MLRCLFCFLSMARGLGSISWPITWLFLISLVFPFSTYAERFINPNMLPALIGSGINSETGDIVSKCLNGTTKDVDNSRLIFSVMNTNNARNSYQETTGSISGSVDFVLFGGGASVSVHTQFSDSTNTVTQIYKVNYKSHGERFDTTGFNTLGSSMIGQTDSTKLTNCGDHYINYVQYGSDLFIVANLAFSSSEEYREYVTKIKVKVLFFKKTFTISDEFYDLAVNARYSISARSELPLPTVISTALNNSDEMVCQSNNVTAMTPCVDATSDIFDYVAAADGYLNWLQNNNNMGILFFETESYVGNGYPEFAYEAPEAIELEKLSIELHNALSYYKRLRGRLQSFITVPVGDVSYYSSRKSLVDNNIAYISNALTTCRNTLDLSSCQNAITTAESQTVYIDF